MADFLCRIGWHRWAKWSPVQAGTATVKAQCTMGVWIEVPVPYEITVRKQDRTCARCGYAQHREVPNDAK